MKKNLVIRLIFIVAVVLAISVNVNFSQYLVQRNLAFKNIEALAFGEGGSGGGGSGGSYYQIIAGCRNYSMSNWVNRCCKGSSISCKHDPCSYTIVEGCSKFGRQDI